MNKTQRFLLMLFLLVAVNANAIHIKGGWMYYEYVKTEPNGDITYKVVVKLYRDCATPNPGQNDVQISITIFRNNDNSSMGEFIAPQTRIYRLQKTSFSECINP